MSNRHYGPAELNDAELDALRGAGFVIGKDVSIDRTADLDRHGIIEIGDGSLVAARACIMSHKDLAGGKARGFPSRDQRTVIGRNVTIGVRAIVLGGVKIGDESVVAAGSVVTGVIPPGVMVAGVPARRKKFVDEIRAEWENLPYLERPEKSESAPVEAPKKRGPGRPRKNPDEQRSG